MNKPFHPDTYTKEHLVAVSKQFGNTDRILIEKVTQALTLLAALNKSNLQFIFKGGTALMLMLHKPSRLSIDIDIIVPDSGIDLDAIFEIIVSSGIFVRYSKQNRFVFGTIEKAHYKFYYTPAFQTHSYEEYILLDVLFEKNPYSRTVQTAIQSPFIKLTGNPEFVNTPSFEEILGDKLTAFAPNTTGIPYYKGRTGMNMEIVKQLFDIGNLFDEVSQIDNVRKTFNYIAGMELNYRDLASKTTEDVLNDMIQTSFCISTRGQTGDCLFNEIQLGLNRIKSYIYGKRFTIVEAITYASKVAYLACMLKTNHSMIQKYEGTNSVKDLLIEDTHWNKLNKLKNSQPEAFWYWYRAIKIM